MRLHGLIRSTGGTTIGARAAFTVGAVLVAGAIGGCGGSSDGLSSSDHDGFISGCTQGGLKSDACECIYTELTGTQGINTKSELSKLDQQIKAGGSTPATIPDSLRKAILACKDKIQPAQ
jgi:hypothetical protein